MHARVIAWTGHRPDLFLDPEAARAALEDTAEQFSAERFLVGGQRGVDTWAALAAHRLGVPFTLVLPLQPDVFARDWSDADRRVLEQTHAWAAEVRVVGGQSEGEAYSQRNRVLATSAHLLVAVWTGRAGGGTAETMAFARAASVPIHEVRLDPAPLSEEATGRGV